MGGKGLGQIGRAPDGGTVAVPLMSWVILLLMTLDYALGMIDRNTVSVLKTTLKGVFQIDDGQYGLLVTAFMIPYAICYVLAGIVVDRIGTRIAFTVFVGVWSVATIAAGMAATFPQLIFWRVVLGAAEAGLLPATIVALVSWFPRERLATAYAIKTPLQFLGPIVSPPLIAWLAIVYGWRVAFYVPGAIGLTFALAWWLCDRNRPSFPTPANAAPVADKLSLRALLTNRTMLAIVAARLISDPVWFFFQYWQAGYLQEVLHLSLADVGRLLWIPPAIVAVLTFGTAGWSDRMIRRGVTAASSRIIVLASTTICAPLILGLAATQNSMAVIAVLTTTYFMTYTWLYLSNLLMADLFPKGSVGAAIGLIGTIGTIGAAVFNWGAGYVVQSYGYTPIFVVCALLHPAALIIVWMVLHSPRARVARPATIPTV